MRRPSLPWRRLGLHYSMFKNSKSPGLIPRGSAHALRLPAKFEKFVAFLWQIAPIMPVLPTYPVYKRAPLQPCRTMPIKSTGFTGCGKTPYLMAVTEFLRELIYRRSMRGEDQKQSLMFSYLTLAQRIPADHPARPIR